jgi:catechol 2,3-dioxygenase-like lactoylglutathione lyase family enzyme
VSTEIGSLPRVQLALNVTDVDQAVDYYQKLFGVAPAKRRPGYANFAIASPPLKLVLIEQPQQAGTLNHLGVEVASSEQVNEAIQRLQATGLSTMTEDGVTCCYALQDKVWTQGPDGERWEVYTVLADAPAAASAAPAEPSVAPACCAS